MSRCFPYLPPGYAGKCASNEALILSIKLQREGEKAKSDRKKERNRAKKEKRPEEKTKGTADRKTKKFTEEKSCHDHRCRTLPRGGHIAHGQEESSHLEKSSVTEEHGRPCSSSDTTENSTKRKRHPMPPNFIQSRGNIIRIQFSCHRQEDLATSSNRGQLCSTSGKTEPLAIQPESRVNLNRFQNVHHPNSATSSIALNLVPKLDKMVHPLQHKTEIVVPSDVASTSHDKKMQKMKGVYGNLFESWVPPPLQCALPNNFDDQDWLFTTKGQSYSGAESLKAGEYLPDLPCHGSAALQLRPQYLQDSAFSSPPFFFSSTVEEAALASCQFCVKSCHVSGYFAGLYMHNDRVLWKIGSWGNWEQFCVWVPSVPCLLPFRALMLLVTSCFGLLLPLLALFEEDGCLDADAVGGWHQSLVPALARARVCVRIIKMFCLDFV
ncbi:hypothetical protein Nepgr_019864 [Nepenthes gracilis]|uniref:Uncharacterized protein n=1 Tax=Nepenthes gracilis TaxID=150966 RepID=A0AAD3SUX3_NEPGR|nr:hypothetical protein Nepgr_019864 [Nepenthes gracilis]